MTHVHTSPAGPEEPFATETTGLELATAPSVVRLGNGDRFDLRIAPVAHRIGDDVVRMLAYNGSIPGPVLHVDQGSQVDVEVRNDGDTEATVHWHGLRLENRYDGVPHETQAPISIGATFRYPLQFPDAGFYWYHPHVREDFGLEMGLYGTIIVEPADRSYWPAADRQLSITLDDLLVEEGHVAPSRPAGPTFTAMGRFGNVMLTNGQTRFDGRAAVNEVVRLYLVNTANTRTFNVALPGAEPGTCPKCGMRLVGSNAPGAPAHAPHHGAEHGAETGDGIEWEDQMPEINRQTDATDMIWKLVDRQTGAENGAIVWAFKVGDRVKIRLVNAMEGSDHPMHHPFHVHGAGRFLVLARQGVPEDNLVWKDTVLVPAGHTVDILLEVSNPGLWMAHCHIAEHAQSGMMFSFDVSR